MDVLVKIFLVIFLLAVNHNVRAQSEEPFEFLSIDRPDISNLPVTVKPDQFQFEIGAESGHNSYFKELTIPNYLLRTGINKKSELRIGFSAIRTDTIKTEVRQPIAAFSISVKYRICEESGLRPAIALQPEANFYSKHSDNAIVNESAYDFIFLFNNTLHKKVFVNYNVGFFYGNSTMEYLLSASFSFLHTHRLGYFLEVYSFMNANDSQLSCDGGITYLVSPRFQIDTYVGRRGVFNTRFNYVGAGIGFRLDKGDLKSKTFKQVGIYKD
jgi:hypothetical protein